MRYTQGTECWYVGDHNRWFRVRITKTYGSARTYQRVVIQAVREYDAEGQVPWPYPDGLEFARASRAFKRLRPLDARPTHPISPSAV